MQTLFENVVVAVSVFFDHLVVGNSVDSWENFFTQETIVLTLISSFLLLIGFAIAFAVNGNHLLLAPSSKFKASSFKKEGNRTKQKNRSPHKALENDDCCYYQLEKVFHAPSRRIEEILSEKKTLQKKVYESPQFLQFYNALLTIPSKNEFIKKAVDVFCETSSGKFATIHLRKSRQITSLQLAHFYTAHKNKTIAKDTKLLARLEAPISISYGKQAQYCNSLIPHVLEVYSENSANKDKNSALSLLCIPLAHPFLIDKELNRETKTQNTPRRSDRRNEWIFGHLQIFIKNASLEKCTFYIQLAHQLCIMLSNFNKKQTEIWMPNLHVFTLSHLLSTINTIGFIRKNSGQPPMPTIWLLHPVFDKARNAKANPQKGGLSKMTPSKTDYERIMYSFFKQLTVEREATDTNFLGFHYHPTKRRVFCVSRNKNNAQIVLLHMLKQFNNKNTHSQFKLEFFPIDFKAPSFPISEVDLLKQAEDLSSADL